MKPEKVVTATHFKAHCLRLLEDVRRSRQPLLVTRHGKPVAEIGPPSSRASAIKTLKGSILHQEDLLAPIAGKWDSAS
ncbi:MAG: type II toxin-antitoxin system Phd/YefM family antitoxin [Steroidobacteraceae bacterium]